MALNEGRAGPVLLAEGAVGPQRQGRQGEASVADIHGRYTEAALRGTIYSAFLKGATTVAAGQQDNAAAAASTNFAILNPQSSGVTLALLKFQVAWHSGTPVAGPITHAVIVGSTITITGSAPIRNKAGAGPLSAAQYVTSAGGTAVTGGTAPVLLRPSGLYMTATAPAPVAIITATELLDGDIILPPGTAWLPLFPNGTWTSPVFSLGVEWEELPYVV